MPAKKGGSKASSNRQGGSKGSDASVDKMLKELGVESGRGRATATGGIDVEEVLERARTYVNDQIAKARTYAQENPKLVLGSLASVVVGAGLLTAAAVAKSRKGGGSKKSSSSRSSSSKGRTSGGSSKSSSKKSAQKKR
jgi:hypothetical protein